ncbi:hypothetical protein Gogos_015412, partial [Gossypium gossypioides]|nr:hypothetical protein [Gossypium gossypioides]
AEGPIAQITHSQQKLADPEGERAESRVRGQNVVGDGKNGLFSPRFAASSRTKRSQPKKSKEEDFRPPLDSTPTTEKSPSTFLDDGMETQSFAKMKRLKLLQLDYVKLEGDFKDFPKSLIWICWHGFFKQSLPVNFDIKRLVVLDIHNNNRKQVWKDKECLPNLKILNLNHSHSLIKTPNFSGLPSLEKLMLKDSIKLVKVDQSIGELKMLTFLNLKDCKSLRKLPRTIGSLISIEELNLSGCSRLDDVPRELRNMKSLKVLNLDETAIYQARLWFPWLLSKRSKELGFSWAFLPGSLVKLSLESCRLSEDVIPDDLWNLASLKLTEVQGIFKLEPIENFEAEEIKRLFNVGTAQECRITSTFVVRSEVPIGFKHCTNENQISFSLPPPSHPEEKIHYFNFCIVFSILSDQIMEFAPSARIFNETKRIMWNHRSCFMGIPKTKDNTLLWLIHWPAMDFQLEGGDLVSCMVVPVHLTIRNFGITYKFEDNIRYQYDFTRSFP